MFQVNILYVAVTRAKRRLVVNSSLRAFLLVTGAWNSVSLRGVAGRRTSGDGSSSSPPVDEARSSGSNCSLCGVRADAGGGGNRLDLDSRVQATDAQQLVRDVFGRERCRRCYLLLSSTDRSQSKYVRYGVDFFRWFDSISGSTFAGST